MFSTCCRKVESSAEEANTTHRVGRGIAIGLVVTGIAVGVIELLVYFNQIQPLLSGVGSLSTIYGLYATLAGFGIALISTIIWTVHSALNRPKGGEEEAKPSTCFPCFKKRDSDIID